MDNLQMELMDQPEWFGAAVDLGDSRKSPMAGLNSHCCIICLSLGSTQEGARARRERSMLEPTGFVWGSEMRVLVRHSRLMPAWESGGGGSV